MIMTREEAIMILKCAMPNSSMGCGESDEEIEEAMNMAIKALEEQQNPNSIRINFVGEEEAKEFEEWMKDQQESVLDKIRAEIKAMSGDIETIVDVLAIIDKYKAESEG